MENIEVDLDNYIQIDKYLDMNHIGGSHKHKLSRMEERYCNCLMHVRPKLGVTAPYGICTKSVYNQQGMKRSKMIDCDNHYKFSNYSKDELKALAKEKEIKVNGDMSQKEMANKLQRILNPKPQKRILIKKY
jgi:hypothetical protein